MKKMLALIAILLISISVYAIDTSLTFGIQNSTINLKQQGQFYIDITLTQPIGNLNIYGNYRNEMNLSRLQPLRFAPKQDYFTVGASYDTGFVTIRAEHMCMHPVVSQSRWFGLQGGYTRFEITLGD